MRVLSRRTNATTPDVCVPHLRSEAFYIPAHEIIYSLVLEFGDKAQANRIWYTDPCQSLIRSLCAKKSSRSPDPATAAIDSVRSLAGFGNASSKLSALKESHSVGVTAK